MKVYGPKGEVYEGEPVDCRELMQLGGYTLNPPVSKGAKEIAAERAAASATLEKEKADREAAEAKKAADEEFKAAAAAARAEEDAKIAAASAAAEASRAKKG